MRNKCEVTLVHPEVVQRVERQLESREKIYGLAIFFKAFADETRIRIMNALLYDTLCVCDLAQLLNMTQSAISHQLQYLRQMNFVVSQKVGKVVYYRLADDHIEQIIKVGLEHIEEGGKYEK